MNPTPPTFHYTAPSLPFTISIPITNDPLSLTPVASVKTDPFELTHPNISLTIGGRVLPLPGNVSSTLSTFIANYISLRDSEVVISTPLFPNVTVDAIFPAMRPKPQILRNVTIRDMKIMMSPAGSQMLASGMVFARVVLPKGIHVGLNVTQVLPDVLVFDGPVPDAEFDLAIPEDAREPPPVPPLPDPLPERAFAHIRPEDWLNATSRQVVNDEGEGTTVQVEAKIVDVPLDVLPGRDREFRNFVGKVCFQFTYPIVRSGLNERYCQVIFGSHGALAGVQGVASVVVRIDGLPLSSDDGRDMELDGLPFQGTVRIGKKSTF